MIYQRQTESQAFVNKMIKLRMIIPKIKNNLIKGTNKKVKYLNANLKNKILNSYPTRMFKWTKKVWVNFQSKSIASNKALEAFRIDLHTSLFYKKESL